MTFEKAMQLLLKGKRMYVPGWSKNHYIRLADSADAVYNFLEGAK